MTLCVRRWSVMAYETKLPRQTSSSTVTEDFSEDSEVQPGFSLNPMCVHGLLGVLPALLPLWRQARCSPRSCCLCRPDCASSFTGRLLIARIWGLPPPGAPPAAPLHAAASLSRSGPR